MFRRKPNKDEKYVQMRLALFHFLWNETHKPTPYYDKNGEIKISRSLPMASQYMNDKVVQYELKQLLG